VVPPESVAENFVINFPVSQFQAQQASMNLKNKVRSTGSLLDKKPVKNDVCLPRRNCEIRAGKEQTPHKSLRRLDLQIVSSQSDEAVNFNLFKRYESVCVYRNIILASLIKKR
jgi:hypothetical protein